MTTKPVAFKCLAVGFYRSLDGKTVIQYVPSAPAGRPWCIYHGDQVEPRQSVRTLREAKHKATELREALGA